MHAVTISPNLQCHIYIRYTTFEITLRPKWQYYTLHYIININRTGIQLMKCMHALVYEIRSTYINDSIPTSSY